MDYFSADDLDSVAYIEDDTNNVIIKFYGFPNKLAAELFISYAMLNMGFDYQPVSGTKSDMTHSICFSEKRIKHGHQDTLHTKEASSLLAQTNR